MFFQNRSSRAACAKHHPHFPRGFMRRTRAEFPTAKLSTCDPPSPAFVMDSGALFPPSEADRVSQVAPALDRKRVKKKKKRNVTEVTAGVAMPPCPYQPRPVHMRETGETCLSACDFIGALPMQKASQLACPTPVVCLYLGTPVRSNQERRNSANRRRWHRLQPGPEPMVIEDRERCLATSPWSP